MGILITLITLAIALGVFLARSGYDKNQIRRQLEDAFGYDLSRSLEQIRPEYGFEVSCQRSVPESIVAFLEADDFESAVRNAISLGGDSDTMACMAGALAQAFYKDIPRAISRQVYNKLPKEFKEIVILFEQQHL